MLALAIAIICIAHIIRVLRWELLIKTYEKPDGLRLTRSLSLGYFLNYFIPFKAGDLVRALFAGAYMKNGRGFALATVVLERCLDIISVGIIFIFFSIYGMRGLKTNALNYSVYGSTAKYYIFIALGLFAALVVMYVLREVIKRAINRFCQLFNEQYEEKLLRFFWALIWGFKDVISGISKINLLMYTVIMWGLYLGSYGLFANFLKSVGVSKDFTDVLFSLFDQKSLLSSGIVNGFIFSSETIWYAVFLLVPSLILMIAAVIFGKLAKIRHIKRSEKVEPMDEADRLNLIPQINTDERLVFLKMYFGGEKKEYIENYLKINRNILVLRDYSAGSNATTILCTDGENNFYRKYAFSDAAKKLEDQIEWLEKMEKVLPVAGILRKDIKDGACYYDMPYLNDALTLFEYAQVVDYKKAWDVIRKVLDCLEDKLYMTGTEQMGKLPEVSANGTDLDGGKERALNRYIDEKIIRNYEIVRSSKELNDILRYDNLIINGKEYKNLKNYRDIFDREKLSKVFKADNVCSIHGDLTIENIVYVKNSDEFYLIDPNTGNIFDSPYIDYAKVLQSLHGKYEYLMAAGDVSVNGNCIEYNSVDSEAYGYLYGKYQEYLNDRFSRDQIRSIYYHEVANWLRLMPYKLGKGNGTVFYAGFIQILNDLDEIK